MMKKWLFFPLFIIVILYVWGYRHYQEKQALQAYDQLVKASITLSHSENAQEKKNFAEKIYLKMQEHPNELRWKRFYSTLLIDFFKDYQGAMSILEQIHQETKDNHILIGICLLKEKTNQPSQACYQEVLKKVEQPYYDDPNYWAAIGGLKQDYTQQDIEKSRLPKEGIKAFLTKDRETLLNSMF